VVRSVARAATALRDRVTAARAVLVVRAAPAAPVVPRESVALPPVVVPLVPRARSAWLLTVVPVVPALPVVPVSTPRA